MNNIILISHVGCAIVMWLLSARAIVQGPGISGSLKTVRDQSKAILVSFILVAISGLALSLINALSGLLSACLRIGLYSSPAFIALGVLGIKMQKLTQKSHELRD